MQDLWTDTMIADFETLIAHFVTTLRKSIGRTRSKSRAEKQENEESRQPLFKTKLHTPLNHCTIIVRHYGSLGMFSEEAFEHFQQVSNTTRTIRAYNKPSAAQILEDLQYSLLLSSPFIYTTLSE